MNSHLVTNQHKSTVAFANAELVLRGLMCAMA